MTELEKLYDLAFENDISVYNYHVSDTKKAVCLHIEDYKNIALDKPAIESSAEESVLLAEEIGHYITGSLYMIEATSNTPIARSNRIKYEARANRWAIEHMLTQDSIQKAIDKCGNDLYEIAEYCNVTIGFLKKALEHYKDHGVAFHWWDVA